MIVGAVGVFEIGGKLVNAGLRVGVVKLSVQVVYCVYINDNDNRFVTGALIAGASDEEADLLYKFGYDLGLAFQIADDWLDTYGDPAVFGKAIGGDIVNNKKSWLLTRAIEKAGDLEPDLRAALEIPVQSGEHRQAKIEAVKNIYDKLGIGEEAQQEIKRLHSQAMESVEKLNLGKIRSEMLHRYADMLLGRRK